MIFSHLVILVLPILLLATTYAISITTTYFINDINGTHVNIFKFNLIALLCAALLIVVAYRLFASDSHWLLFSLSMVFGLGLIIIGLCDLKTKIIPDLLSIPLLGIGLVINYSHIFVSFHNAIIGAIAGFLFLYLVSFISKKLTGSLCLGLGDAKLLAAIGAWLGWTSLPFILLIACILSLLFVSKLMLFKQYQKGVLLPFGQYLSMAALGVITFIYWP